jgi:hypothetical protein
VAQSRETREDEGRYNRICLCPCEPIICRDRAVEQQRRPQRTCAHRSKRDGTAHIHNPILYSNSTNLGARDWPFFTKGRDESEAFLSRRSPTEALREGEYKTRPALPSRNHAPYNQSVELTPTELITAQAMTMHDVSTAAHLCLVDLSCFAATEL